MELRQIDQNNSLFDKAKFILIVFLGIFIMASTGWAATYYVDTTVQRSGNGSSSEPWQSISDISGLRDGDIVLFKRGGVWHEQLSPLSGSIGHPITYGAYGSGEKPVIRNFYANGKSYIRIEDIEFKSNGSDYPVYVTNKSHHIKFFNVDMHAESGCSSWAAARLYDESHHIEMHNCDIYHKGSGSNDGLNLKNGVKYCLIRNSRIGTAGHSALAIIGRTDRAYSYESNYNIISNNTIHNPRDRALEIMQNANWNVIEGNTIQGCDAGSCSTSNNTRSFKLITANNIIRQNIFRANESELASTAGLSMRPYQAGDTPVDKTTNNHIYNNIITDITSNPVVLDDIEPQAACEIKRNQFKNNICYANDDRAQIVIDNDSSIADNYFNNNIFYKSGVTNVLDVGGAHYDVAEIESSDPLHWSGNLQQDPKLGTDYYPDEGSPVIDKGDFLTKITSESGSGKEFTVDDAMYFIDGFGITQGDRVQIGTTVTMIEAIDYTTHTITVTESISWQKGAPISLPYNGNRPDIGVFEANNAGTQLPPPTNLRILD